MTATFCDFTPAEISSVHPNGLSTVGTIPNLRLRLGGRDGWRDAEERGEGMGWREKERRGVVGGTAAGSFFPVIIPGRCFSQPHLMKVK